MQMGGEIYSFVLDFFSELELSLEVKLALGFILFSNGDVLFNR
jgi:hypothetical protein